MASRKRLSFALASGVFCAIAGSLLGAVVVLIRALQGTTQGMVEALAFFPAALVFVAIPAAPFGFIVGSLGGWWLAVRADRGVSWTRLYFESAGVGGVLGATFPLILAVLGWGPFNNLVSALPISITIGIVCGIMLIPYTRKHVAVPS